MDLPYENIVNIFKFLSYSDRKIARLACKQFYDASLDETFVREEILLFIKERLYKDPDLSVLRNSYRIFRNFYFVDIDFTTDVSRIFEKFGDNIHSLIIENCGITDQQFINMLLRCKNLKLLTLKSCEDPLRGGRFSDERTVNLKLDKMKYLKIQLSRYLSDAFLCQFIHFCPNLQSISLSDCYINFHVGVFHFFYPRYQKNALQKPSINGLTFRCIMEVLELKSKNIKNLDFSSTYLNDSALKQLCGIENLKLQSLNLTNCRELKFKQLNIWSLQSSLTELYLSNCLELFDEVLLDICENLINLKVLKIANCLSITDTGLMALNRLKYLQCLDISKCINLSIQVLVNQLCLVVPMRIFIANDLKLKESDFIIIVKKFDNLKELQVSSSFCSDESVNKILQNLTKLNKLVVSKNTRLTDLCLEYSNASITHYFTTLERITEIVLNVIKKSNKFDPRIFEDSIFEQLCNELITSISTANKSLAFSNLENLSFLDLSDCNTVSDPILYFSSAFKNLNVILLGHTKITDKGLVCLSLNCPALEVLQLKACKISDVAIYFIVKHLQRISNLDISDCIYLTDASLTFILYYCTSISELDVSHCYKMTNEMIDKVSSMPSVYKVYGYTEDSSEYCESPPSTLF